MNGSKACFSGRRLLNSILTGYPDMALALSGGVDSGFLLAAAQKAGVRKLVAITVVTRFVAERERLRAVRVAAALGVPHVCVELDILGEAAVMENSSRRCYHCKQAMFSQMAKAARDHEVHTLVHGVNLDDLKDFRPGLEAAAALGFKTPLADAGFSKEMVRAGARDLGLDIWDLPSQSCLATRIPQGDPITLSALERVERAEAFLYDMGFLQVRVRCHGKVARIELDPDDVGRLMEKTCRTQVADQLRKIGFSHVACDLSGYQTGY